MVRRRVEFHKIKLQNDIDHDYTYADMHFHTKYSFDSSALFSNIVKKCRKYGFGLAATDHDVIKGAIELSKHKDIFSIPGIELRCDRGFHTLLFFYHISELVEYYDRYIKPTIKKRDYLTAHQILDATEDYNCVSVMPHPFAPGATSICNKYHRNHVCDALLDRYHGVEVIQGCNIHKRNLQAIGLASDLRKGITGGSDGHTTRELGNTLTFVKEDADIDSFLDAIRKRQNRVIGKNGNSVRDIMCHLGKLPAWVKNTKYYAKKGVQRIDDVRERRIIRHKKKQFIS